jgi:hypothetical protein
MATTTAPTPAIQYTARDFDTNLAALQQFIQTVAPTKWTSFYEGDLGSALLEAMAYGNTLQSFTLDMMTQECFLDTLNYRESLVHFARLTGYTLRRASAASIAAYAVAAAPPASVDLGYTIAQGTQIRSKDGQVWEVSQDYQIAPGNFSPINVEQQFGNVFGQVVASDNTLTTISALVHIPIGSSVAVLCSPDGTRLPSISNFGPQVNAGSLLVLGNQQTGQTNNVSTSFGPPPVYGSDQYAIIQVSQYSYDIYQDTILYLDRPWDGGGANADFIGQWQINNCNIILTQGQTQTDTFNVAAGTNVAGYQVQALYYPVLAGANVGFIPSGFFGNSTADSDQGVQVFVNGQLWDYTTSLLFEAPDSTAYTLLFDELDRMVITFGDGTFGALLPQAVDGSGTNIIVIYRTGGGTSGNLPQNSIDTSLTASVTGSQPSSPVTIYVSNPYTTGSGGQERETITAAKQNIPQFIRTNDRAVAAEDYSYLASNFTDPINGSIALAVGVLHQNQVPLEQNIVWVYCWVHGINGQLAPPTYNLKTALLAYLNDRKMITDEVVIVDGLVTTVPIDIRYKVNSAAIITEVDYQVQGAINSVFAALTPGSTLYLSELFAAVTAIAGVDYVNIYGPLVNVTPQNQFDLMANSVTQPQFAQLLTAATLGATSVTVTNPSIFSVNGQITLYDLNSQPTTALVASVSGSTVTLQTPLLDKYSLNAIVINTDYLAQSWQFEDPQDVYVLYTSGTGTSASTTAAINQMISSYFLQVLQPEQTLLVSTLVAMLSTINNITSVIVTIGSLSSTVEQVVPASSELLTLGSLTINNALQ